MVFFVFCKKKYKESFGTLVELISDEDAATLMPEADEVELDKVIDAAVSYTHLCGIGWSHSITITAFCPLAER